MSNNVEWAEASYAARVTSIVEPEQFRDEDDTYFDTDGTVPEGAYGIPVHSGGHTTLVVGTLAELQAWAIEIIGEVYVASLKEEAS